MRLPYIAVVRDSRYESKDDMGVEMVFMSSGDGLWMDVGYTIHVVASVETRDV